MSGAASARAGGFSIGEVLSQLRSEFPDVTISKIRFLEAEGLVEPQRAPSGYRKFAHDDIERLRFVLTAQRDHYLPLRVIKDHLDALDRGLQPAQVAGGRPVAPAPRVLLGGGEDVDPETFKSAGPELRLTRRELIEAAEIKPELFDQLESYGLVAAGTGVTTTTRTPSTSPRRQVSSPASDWSRAICVRSEPRPTAKWV